MNFVLRAKLISVFRPGAGSLMGIKDPVTAVILVNNKLTPFKPATIVPMAVARVWNIFSIIGAGEWRRSGSSC